jgi:hypothetical protein
MNRFLATSGIRLNDCLFTEPSSLAGWRPPQYAGLFAIFVRDPDWAPKPLQPICFGEFGNNAPAAVFLSNYTELLAAATGRSLLIAACPMPFSTTSQRRAVRDELVWAYNPICRIEGSGSLRKQDERQHAQMMPLSADPQAEQQREPRRRIGFMPECRLSQ